MSATTCPTTFSEIEDWSNQEGVSFLEGRRKYIQFLTLQAIANSSSLRQALVFKGGNALEFIYLENRTTTDLDFTYLREPGDLDDLKEWIRVRFSIALERINDGVGTVVRLQGIEQRPRGKDKTHVTYKVRLGWALPDQDLQRQRLLAGQGSQIVDLDISVNENVCAFTATTIAGVDHPINVSTIEDIVAEKLRAILQQPIRKRSRIQDVLDIAMIYRTLGIDTELVSQFLPEKCVDRVVVPSKSAFRNPEVRDRSSQGYESLERTVRHTFIPFDEAWGIVMDLVDSLDIPD